MEGRVRFPNRAVMEWTKDNLSRLDTQFILRYNSFRLERRTDPRNLSELWNRHLEGLGITVVRPSPTMQRRGKKPDPRLQTLSLLVRIINEDNRRVSDSVCVNNPDRPGQVLLVPRELAEKVIFIGFP